MGSGIILVRVRMIREEKTVYSIHIKLSKLLLQRMIRQPLIYAPVQHMIACAVTTLVKEGIRKSKDLGGGDAR
jgi:hypothetical protein